METKHTKGKWFACCTKSKPHFLFTDNGEKTICAFSQKQDNGIDLPIEEVRANAKLIASAPEMLEMLERISKMHPDSNPITIIKEAQQLISKITE